MVTAEEIKKTVANYQANLNGFAELSKTLMEIEGEEDYGITGKTDRVIERLEKMERDIAIIEDSLENIELDDKEEVTLMFLLEGRSVGWVAAKIFKRSKSVPTRAFNNVVEKMAEYINETYE